MFKKIALAVVVISCSAVGVKAQDGGDDFGVSSDYSTYVYNGSNGCEVGACDSSWGSGGGSDSTVTDDSAPPVFWSGSLESWEAANSSNTDMLDVVKQAASNLASNVENSILDAAQTERDALNNAWTEVTDNPAGAAMSALNLAASAVTFAATDGAIPLSGALDMESNALSVNPLTVGTSLMDSALNGKSLAAGLSGVAGSSLVELSNIPGGSAAQLVVDAGSAFTDTADAGAKINSPKTFDVPVSPWPASVPYVSDSAQESSVPALIQAISQGITNFNNQTRMNAAERAIQQFDDEVAQAARSTAVVVCHNNANCVQIPTSSGGATSTTAKQTTTKPTVGGSQVLLVTRPTVSQPLVSPQQTTSASMTTPAPIKTASSLSTPAATTASLQSGIQGKSLSVPSLEQTLPKSSAAGSTNGQLNAQTTGVRLSSRNTSAALVTAEQVLPNNPTVPRQQLGAKQVAATEGGLNIVNRPTVSSPNGGSSRNNSSVSTLVPAGLVVRTDSSSKPSSTKSGGVASATVGQTKEARSRSSGSAVVVTTPAPKAPAATKAVTGSSHGSGCCAAPSAPVAPRSTVPSSPRPVVTIPAPAPYRAPIIIHK